MCFPGADLAELRTTLASHATHLTSLDSDVQVLRQMAPVHGASLKATEAALQLLRESTERTIEGLRQDIAMDQKRRTYQEERAADQHREAEVSRQKEHIPAHCRLPLWATRRHSFSQGLRICMDPRGGTRSVLTHIFGPPDSTLVLRFVLISLSS